MDLPSYAAEASIYWRANQYYCTFPSSGALSPGRAATPLPKLLIEAGLSPVPACDCGPCPSRCAARQSVLRLLDYALYGAGTVPQRVLPMNGAVYEQGSAECKAALVAGICRLAPYL